MFAGKWQFSIHLEKITGVGGLGEKSSIHKTAPENMATKILRNIKIKRI